MQYDQRGVRAAVIVSEKLLDARRHLRLQAIFMGGQSMMTDSSQLYSKSSIDLVDFDMTARATKAAMTEAGVT